MVMLQSRNVGFYAQIIFYFIHNSKCIICYYFEIFKEYYLLGYKRKNYTNIYNSIEIYLHGI